ncbi:MAG: SH3 domain-containing protein [Aggregatilineales bacterium]
MFFRKHLLYAGLLCLLFVCISGLSLAQIPQPVRDAIADLNEREGTSYNSRSFNWDWEERLFEDRGLECKSGETATTVGYIVRLRPLDQLYVYHISYDPVTVIYLCRYEDYRVPPTPIPVTPSATPLPTFTFTPTPAFCENALSPRLSIREQGQITPGDPNNLRAEPDGSAPRIAGIPGEGIFRVLDGPRCSEEGIWWYVNFEGIEGWTLEGTDDTYYAQPYSVPIAPTITIESPAATIVSPAVSSTPSTCGNLSPRLSIGESARVTPGIPNNIRDNPTATGLYLGEIPAESPFTVIDGPRCSRDGTWWFVDYQGTRGWTLEGNNTDYYTEPMSIVAPTATQFIAPTVPTALPTFTPTFAPTAVPTEIVCVPELPSRLVIGEQARITPGIPNNVREQPGTSGRYLGEIPAEAVFTVLDGPRCGSGFAWWQVDYQGMVGWTPEGQPGDYWMEPLNIPITFATVPDLRQIAAWSVGTENLPTQLHFASDTALYIKDQFVWRAWDSPQQTVPVIQRTWQEVPPLTEGLLARDQLNIVTDENGLQITTTDGQPVTTLPPAASTLLNTISPDGRYLASQNGEFTVTLWDIDPLSPGIGTGQSVGSGHASPLMRVFFSEDSSHLATVSASETVVINLTDRTLVTIPQGIGINTNTTITLSTDGAVLLFSTLEDNLNRITIYDTVTGNLIRDFIARDSSFAEGIVFTPDNSLMAAYMVSTLPGSEGLRSIGVTIWDVENGQELLTLTRTGNPITRLMFNPSGTMLAIADDAGTIELWAVGTAG